MRGDVSSAILPTHTHTYTDLTSTGRGSGHEERPHTVHPFLKKEPDAIRACGENDDQCLGQRLAFVRDAMRKENVSVSCSDCTMLFTHFSVVAAFSDGGLISLSRPFSKLDQSAILHVLATKNEFNS